LDVHEDHQRHERSGVKCTVTVILGLAVAGCVTSKTPLLGPDSRVLPFLPGSKFETYERDDARAPWQKNDALTVFTADQGLEIRELDEAGKPKNPDITTIHPLGPGRFLVQTHFVNDGRYAYGVLDIHNGEGVITGFGCKVIDQDAFRRQGGKVMKEACELDAAPDPLAILRELAAKPAGPQMRYVRMQK
jgi:hypothetical protein